MILDQFKLDSKVVVVTGASSGLGVAFALGLAEAGADLAIGARRSGRLSETRTQVEALGRRCIAVETDVTDPASCSRFIASAMDEFGRVDVLVNNAGTASAMPATREAPDDFRAVVEVNLFGGYWMAQACGRVMQPGSSIVNIGSAAGFTSVGLPQAAYSASKAALIGLTRDLAQQWSGRKGIRVNLLVPGIFPTDLSSQFPEEVLERMTDQRIPMRRLGDISELVAALIFLASDASSYVTGTQLVVDGGMLTN